GSVVVVLKATTGQFAGHGRGEVVAQLPHALDPFPGESTGRAAIADAAAAAAAAAADNLCHLRTGCVEGGRRFLQFCVCVSVGDVVDDGSRLFKFGVCDRAVIARSWLGRWPHRQQYCFLSRI
ncbi:unnamed protein product, partial [Ectocarpus sp. 4 AP-2014]